VRGGKGRIVEVCRLVEGGERCWAEERAKGKRSGWEGRRTGEGDREAHAGGVDFDTDT